MNESNGNGHGPGHFGAAPALEHLQQEAPLVSGPPPSAPIAMSSMGPLSQGGAPAPGSVPVPAPGQDKATSVAAIARIGDLLDRVSDLANNARQSFHQGQHERSSLCLTDLQRSLTEIGELGSRSLALVSDGQMQEKQRSSSSSSSQDTHQRPGGHRRTATESALKKRPANEVDIDFSPFKTLRSQDGTPINPPPSAPPVVYDDVHSASTGSGVPAPASAPAHPPSAPPIFSSAPPGHQMAVARAQPTPPHRLQIGNNPQAFNHGAASLQQSPVTPQSAFSSYYHGANGSRPQGMMTHPSTPSSESLPGSSQMSQSSSTNHVGSALQMALHNQQQQHHHQPQHGQGLPAANVPPSPQESWGQTDSSFEGAVSRDSQPSMAPQPHPSSAHGQQMTHHRRTKSGNGKSGSSSSSLMFDLHNGDDNGDSSTLASERGMSGATVPPELKTKLERIFFEFLEKVCSDIDYCDSKGEHLHQIREYASLCLIFCP